MVSSRHISDAFERCRGLSAIIRHVRNDALKRPNEEIWRALGLVMDGDTKAEAISRLERRFDELQALIDHIFILDMAAQFERTAAARIENYIGSARSAFAKRINQEKFPALATAVVKEASDFQGLNAYVRLLESHIDGELKDKLKLIRGARNSFAHGIDVRVPPPISAQDARDTLIDSLTMF